ncbi:DNA primase small subunit isoform X1 [Selaginella moellendorffii]|uniref:DNA primase small subunit isoform X1 n=1 Tax=Selaginella moellendorffii TaxID=88036 RepID=UPI000D1CA868|nr:DNA primase small subunit isoform X1 [Selaginella moellendorffii]|eukprot:XP_024514934.1 DNA primase small subunit isoform X1 [Selaginella moellendorffii]
MAGDPMEIDGFKQQQGQALCNPELLSLYYRRIFPFAEMYKWLSYGNDGKHPSCDSSFFGRREFSFTLENDIYLRYMSFRDASEFEATVCEKRPQKIDIGAVYSVDPAKRLAYASVSNDRVFAPVEKELVFDVDMTDYDDIRNCCSGADICLKCWPLMTIAIKVVDSTLREDFGFDHILWVYSGRRGVHCWVCDARARKLTNEQRASIADYFRVYKGNENNNRKVSLPTHLHPFLARTYSQFLSRYFDEEILIKQSLLHPQENADKVLKLVSGQGMSMQYMSSAYSELPVQLEEKKRNNRLLPDEINRQRWADLQRKLMQKRGIQVELVFTYTYPRLDLEVTKKMNHLLKAPFCIHPKTGRVCVPIDPEDCDNFDPTTVPTLPELFNDLNNGDARPVSKDWERTSLAKSIRFFKSSFLEPLLKECRCQLEASHHKKLQEMSARPNFTW